MSEPSFVIVNVHHSLQENEVKEELLNNSAMNVIQVHQIVSTATGKPINLIRVTTDCSKAVNGIKVHRIRIRTTGKSRKLICLINDCSNYATAAVENGVKIGWVLHRCKPNN